MALFLFTLFIVICVLLILVVLLQKGRGGGLGAAFGGMGSTAFGTRTGDVFTWVTIVLTALFLLLAIGTHVWIRPAQQAAVAVAFTPAQMAIEEPLKISMRSTTKNVKILYTMDGSDPVENAPGTTAYEGVAVTVRPGTTVKAVATRADLKASEVTQAYYGPAETTTAPATMPAAQPDSATMPATVPAN